MHCTYEIAISSHYHAVLLLNQLACESIVNSSPLIARKHSAVRSGTTLLVVLPPLPRDGGTARTAILVHAVNLIELG